MHKLARYRFVRRLGSGAAGGVYLVEDRVLGGPLLALKRVEQVADRALRDSFAREFAVLASLAVPGVARVHDLGVAPASDDIPAGPFFTRDYVAGAPLSAWAREHAVDARERNDAAEELVRVFLRVLAVASRLHRRAVIHGDLHPGNVIVDALGAPHLIDFGLASRASDRLSGAGTPPFMAPEQLAGASSSMSADVYALGATLWAVLTGRPPLAELGERMLGAKLRGELPHIEPQLPELARQALEAALWALAPDPRERAPSVDELAARIERLTGLPAERSELAVTFVAPRPRGRTELLDALTRQARADDVSTSADARGLLANSALLAGDAGRRAERGITVLHGPRGIGKSTVLCELKWRLQLEGVPVLELRCGEGALPALGQLARQLALVDSEVAALAARADEPVLAPADQRALVRALARALSSPERRYVLLIDDLDREGSSLGQVLREAAHRAEGRPPIVIASVEARAGARERSEDEARAGARERSEVEARSDSDALGAPGLSGLVDLDAIAVLPLAEADQRALIGEALGPVDEGTADALVARAAGNPGLLLEALAWLSQRDELTARELSQLATGELSSRLAAERTAGLSEPARSLLGLLAAARGPLSEHWLAALLADAFESARAELLERALVRDEGGRLFVPDPAFTEWLRSPGEAEHTGALLALALASVGAELEPVTCVELALYAGERPLVEASIGAALAELTGRGLVDQALHLCEACLARGWGAEDVRLAASELYAEAGDCARTAEYAEPLLERPALDHTTAARARLAAARAHVAAGRLERAVALLSELPEDAPRTLRARAARELARVHLRKGEADAARAAVERGLAAAGEQQPERAELAAIAAILLSQGGDHAGARQQFAQALTLARELAAPREEALVLGYRAMSEEQQGALADARADYEAGLAAARRAGDLGLTGTYALNLGNVSQRLGELDGVEQHYTLAARLLRRAGRTSTALLADNNLATLHVHLGSFSRARVLAEASLAEAERLGLGHLQGHALTILAALDARSGEAETALARYDAAAACYSRLGRPHELAEIWLDAAEVLLDRGGVSDISAAAAKLASARELVERHDNQSLRRRLRLLIARARAGNGDSEGAVRELGELARTLLSHPERDRELLWQVLAAEAQLHAQLGASLLAGRKAREAAELIELAAARAPREVREAFCADPRRRAVLELARESAAAPAAQERGELAVPEPRFTRLLELIKRLARERDLPRLLERITDAAVDLSGAERGFVLLVDAAGQLAPHTVRASGGAESDPHVAFSRSIAEAVLIDGEPIVTVNARDDRRLNEFMSVHKLMLKSVACIPISGPVGVVGVLYLEHRLRAGRFQESDIDLLVAFADQAAIALENARLWSENEQRRKDLEAKAAELALAKDEIERLLEARTEELEQARRDLGRARAELEGQSSRHGMVGQSAVMRRVFSLIERVADSPVPVVIEGESGTGKELVARSIHFGGARKKAPFIALNCAALPEHLLESELFGHVRGAFTGAERDKRGLFSQADGGTIFLDEFADMPPRMQIDLLRVLQERCIRPVGAERDLPIDVRVIAATNRPLKQLVASGRLREDLYYRMSVVEIRLPSLRERPEDIPLLCDHFLSRLAERAGARPRRLSRSALERIKASALPGNVRQLEHMLTSAAMMADGTFIEVEDLALEPEVNEGASASERPPEPEAVPADPTQPNDIQGYKLREKRRIIDALEQHGWNRAKAAHALGMPRRTFYRRLSEFNIL